MKPEDIDKLFKERLGPSSPMPPADLWNRLQDRIETEMPTTQEQEQKSRGFMYLSYSIAAAIAMVLTVGVVFFNIQRGNIPTDGMAHTNTQIAEQPLVIAEPMQGIAKVEEPTASPAATEAAIPEATTTPATVSAKPVAKAAQKTIAKVDKKAATRSSFGSKASASATQLAAQVEKPAIPETVEEGLYYNTGETAPVSFAANTADMNAQPVEIIIKRAVQVQQVEQEDELTGFEKKQKLAKNIFKQVRNLSNGEKVELNELGINADRIALETQIGKQKISKVINL